MPKEPDYLPVTIEVVFNCIVTKPEDIEKIIALVSAECRAKVKEVTGYDVHGNMHANYQTEYPHPIFRLGTGRVR